MCVAYFDVQTLDDYLNMLGICTALTGCEENYAEYGEVVRAAGGRGHRAADRRGADGALASAPRA